jgi:hypothetical protein
MKIIYHTMTTISIDIHIGTKEYELLNTHKIHIIRQYWMANKWTYVNHFANDLHWTSQKATINKIVYDAFTSMTTIEYYH